MPSIILLVVGTALLIWRKEIAEFVYTTQRPWYKMMFGSLFDLDRPWFRKLYDWAVIAAAVLLFLGAYAAYFGPIST